MVRTLTFSSTSLSQQVSVNILTDGLFEDDEQFLGNLASSGDSRIILDPMSATVSIQDVDGKTLSACGQIRAEKFFLNAIMLFAHSM